MSLAARPDPAGAPGPAVPGGPIAPGAPIPGAIWRLCAVIAAGAFMSGVDTTIVAVGLDTIARDLDASLADAQWVAGGYLIALGVSLPACAWAGRRLGVGRLWLGALAAFTVASGLCALAPTIETLIALRVVQGLAAGLLIPAGQTIIGQAVGPARLGEVMATLGLAVALAPAVGPVAGGVLLHAASWPWLFLVNLPIGGVALALAWRLVPRGAPQAVGRLDVRGLLLVTAAVPLVVYGFTVWGELGSAGSARVLVPLGVGLLAGAAFAWHARRAPRPVLDLGLLRIRAFSAAALTAAFAGAAMFGASILFPLFFQLGRGADVLDTGLLLISMSVGSALVLPVSGRLVDRVGGGRVAVAGALATLLTTVPFAVLPLDASEPLVQVLLLVRGMALALALMPAMSASYKLVGGEALPDATTLMNIVLRVGGALGGALFATILAARLATGSAESAFHVAFWWLTAATALGGVAALWLAAEERRAGRP